MSFEEKVTWVSAAVFTLIPVRYFAEVYGKLGQVPVSDIAYQRPMITAIGVTIILIIVGSIATAVGSAITAEIEKPGSSSDVGRSDERDATINRRGEFVGYHVSSVGAVAAMALAMLEYDYFWIANALYLSFVVAALVSTAVKLIAYRRGF